MKSPHSNAKELQALSAIPQAPFPLTPSAAALKAAQSVKLAALKRPGLDDEEKTLTDASTADGQVIAEDGLATEGAALEALAPPPLPEMSGMDMLLAQAGPAATGGGATGGGMSLGTGLAIGGAVVLLGAAGGGGSSSPAPAPAPAPAGPPNQPASINASEPQRTGAVQEDHDLVDQREEYTNTTGNSATTALKITDPDGGADLTFRAATAEELQGKYGDFSFDAATGIWSYTLDNSDPDTQALDQDMGDGEFDAYDYLTVYSKDGTASSVIEVGINGHNDDFTLNASDNLTVNAGDTYFVDLSVQDPQPGMYYDYASPGNGIVTMFREGGFALYTANAGGTPYDTSLDYYAYDDNGNISDGQVTFHVVADDAGSEAAPSFDGVFIVNLVEGTPSAILKAAGDDMFDDPDQDGTFTLAMRANVGDDGHFVLDAQAGITIFGNGTNQVAVQGSLADINAYLQGSHLKFTADTNDAASNTSFDAYLLDDDGNMATRNFYETSYTPANDLPVLEVLIDDGEVVASPTLYLPATGTEHDGTVNLGNFAPFYVNIYDEEIASGVSDWVYLTMKVDAGSLTIADSVFDNYNIQVFWDNDRFDDGDWLDDSDAMHTDAYRDVGEVILRSHDYSALYGALNYHTSYTAPEAFPVGATHTLTLELADSNTSSPDVSRTISLVAAQQNDAPFFSLDTSSPFLNFTVTDEGPIEGGELAMDGSRNYRFTEATADLREDQHISFKGVAINDPDASGGDSVYVSFYAYAYQINDEGDIDTDGLMGHFYLDDAYASLLYNEHVGNEGYISFLGSIDAINAMLAANGLHYAPPPDFDGNASADDDEATGLYFDIELYDMGHTGYGEGGAEVTLYVNMIGVNDLPVALHEIEEDVEKEGAKHWLPTNELLSSDYVYDTEFHTKEGDGALDITAIVVVAGTGTVAKDAEMDGEWAYTWGAGDDVGETIVLRYTFSDGTYSASNIANLLLTDDMPQPV